MLMRKISQICILALLLLPAGLGAAVPTPASVLGKTPGDDFYLASYTDAKKYFETAAKGSDRIKLFVAGKSTRGQDIIYAAISSPENLAKLDHYKEVSRRLALSRGLTDEQALALARESKPFVHIDGGLHSSEVAGGQHSIILLYKLLSSNDAQVKNILDNVIVLLWPTLNPDGQNMVVDWYRQNVGTPYEVSPMPWLYQDYVGHDNNRDGYMLNMAETRVVTKTEIEYNPVIFYCQHQTAPLPARIWIPPFSDPISSNIHPLLVKWLNVIGTQMAAGLDEAGLPGAIHENRFDNWYAGFTDFTHIFRHEIAFFTETALYRYATPHFYTVEDFPKDRQSMRGEVMYSSPWKGGWWRLGDAVNYMVTASMSVLDTSARYHDTLLYNRYMAARDNIKKFQSGPPYAYVIPSEQKDVPEAAELAQRMIDLGLEVQRTKSAFQVGAKTAPAGSWVILMDQPFSGLAKELFERQQYPTPQGADFHLPYDITGWTLPLQLGVSVLPVAEPVTAAQRASLEALTKIAPAPGDVKGQGSTFVLSHNTNAAFRALNASFAAGASVALTKDGNFAVSGIARQKFAAIAAPLGLTAEAPAQAPETRLELKQAKVALYKPWVASMDEGWTRWILEQYGFAPKTVTNADLKNGILDSGINVLVIPDITRESLMEGYKEGVVPPQYSGGIGQEGLVAIRNFVQRGGTVVAFNKASSAMISLLDLPVKDVVEGLKPDKFFCAGALLSIELQNAARPVVLGLDEQPTIVFERGPVFETKPGFEGAVLATYPATRNPLASGFLLHPEAIQGKAVALEVVAGKGRVFLLGFRPQWRAQSHNTYKFFMNALYDFAHPAPPAASAPKQEAATAKSVSH